MTATMQARTRRVLEVADLDILPGHTEAFEADAALAVPLFEKAAGCLSMRIERSIENPLRYRLMVEWETLEHHTVTFRGDEAFKQWRALAGPHFASGPLVEHSTIAVSGFVRDKAGA